MHVSLAVTYAGPITRDEPSADAPDQRRNLMTASSELDLEKVRLARVSAGLVRDDHLLEACRRNSDEHKTVWSFLMVPKTGGTSMTAWSRSCAPMVKASFHNGLYTPCSIASMREPCSRARSAFGHLRAECLRICNLRVPFNRSTPGSLSSCAASEVTACHLSNHATFLEYAKYLESHWQKAVMKMPLVVRDIRRVNVVVLPQYLWVGNASQIVCTERMDAELPKVAASVGLRCPNHTIPHEDHGVHRNEKDAPKPDSSGDKEACRIIRGLYDVDTQLWNKYCSGGQLWQTRIQDGEQARTRSAMWERR